MSGKISLLLGIFLIVASTADGAESPRTPLAGDLGVLLLRNGQVIEGHIERDGDHYTVTLPDQELQIGAASVEFCCHDLREGYRQKKTVLQPNDIEQHLQLFLWCERHGLLDCADEELDAADSLNHEHPMISVLRRRLKVEIEQKKEPRRLSENSPPPPSNEQLDQMTRGMPPGTVELFVQVVQPILLNHCPGAIGYAIPGQKRLQLMRPPLGESPNRRITQRNLHAILECIDWNNPGESPLLKASVGSGVAGAVGSFPSKHSMQYEKLAQWVYQVAQKPMPADEMVRGGVENASFADLAGGALAPRGPAAMNRPAPQLPYLPSPKNGTGKSAAEPAGDSRPESGGNPQSGGPTKPLAVPRPSGIGLGARKTRAENAAPAIDAIDPYAPAAFNNQANAPAILPTPAARVLHGNEK
ncbi:MAG: hypothetical protein WCJ35_08370 [Planctomycetota bacterium]